MESSVAPVPNVSVRSFKCQQQIKTKKKDSWPKSRMCINCKIVDMYDSLDDYYSHLRQCGRGKFLSCSICPFATAHKHHFVYHVRNHYKLKPFRCKLCSYVSINKAMLTSHEKSHKSLHQFACVDCTFSTKFLNALKKHCRQNTHQPAIPLNSKGEPDSTILVDLHGSRRGKRKNSSESLSGGVNGTTFYPADFNNGLALQKFQHNGMKPANQGKAENGGHKCNICDCIFLPNDILEFSKHLEQHVEVDVKRMESGKQFYDSDSCPSSVEMPSPQDREKPPTQKTTDSLPTNPSPLDLTKSTKVSQVSKVHEIISYSPRSTNIGCCPDLKKQIGKPEIVMTKRCKDNPAPPFMMKPLPQLQPISAFDDLKDFQCHNVYLANYLRSLRYALHPYSCQICGNTFERRALFDFHMSFHSPMDPLMCNYCQEQTKGVLSFNEHMTQCQAFLKK